MTKTGHPQKTYTEEQKQEVKKAYKKSRNVKERTRLLSVKLRVTKGMSTKQIADITELSVAEKYPNDYILLGVDNAAWHKSKTLKIPENIELFPLLPYTPELNPIEMIRDELREKFRPVQ